MSRVLGVLKGVVISIYALMVIMALMAALTLLRDIEMTLSGQVYMMKEIDQSLVTLGEIQHQRLRLELLKEKKKERNNI